MTWQEKQIEKAEEHRDREITRQAEYYRKQVEAIRRACDLKVRLIKALRKEPSDIFGDNRVFIRTDNHLLVHDVSKELGIELKRKAESDGFNFTGEYEGIPVRVYGMQTVPHCKIVTRKEMQEVTIYEEVCNEKEGEQK